MIEYARIMTVQELRDFFASISRNHNEKKSKAWECLLQNKNVLIDDYHKFEQQRVDIYYEEKLKLRNVKKSWDNKVCDTCCSKMKLVNSDYGDFWGCTNFRDPSHKHRTFPLNYDEYFFDRWQNLNVRIDANWATNIIRQNNLQATVKATDLLNFYDEFCLEDLREKYGYRNSKDRISGYVKAKKASSIEEKEITKHLSSIFKKSNEQRGVRYKLKDDKEKVAIIDLILSDDDEVNIIEIKRSVLDLKEEQLLLYHQLIAFLLNETNDVRVCRSLFIVYCKDTFSYKPDCKYLLYETIKNLNDHAVIRKHFDDCGYLNGS